jgi:hypothetical protein
LRAARISVDAGKNKKEACEEMKLDGLTKPRQGWLLLEGKHTISKRMFTPGFEYNASIKASNISISFVICIFASDAIPACVCAYRQWTRMAGSTSMAVFQSLRSAVV